MSPCPHCGVPHLSLATRTSCDDCYRAWRELSDAGRRLEFEQARLALAFDRAHMRRDVGEAAVPLTSDLLSAHADWVAARDAHDKAQATWDAMGKLREQRLGLASAEPRP